MRNYMAEKRKDCNKGYQEKWIEGGRRMCMHLDRAVSFCPSCAARSCKLKPAATCCSKAATSMPALNACSTCGATLGFQAIMYVCPVACEAMSCFKLCLAC